ncbi:YaiO family outer membrane beta-barrel protein [Christiangramia aquimixticola]|uniref:YaiO family outer membrane beta-barrel protein n=1 Tax=Christiangramia aquimixticola TaxID=1697558 RepID=UPI003AA928FC
MLKNSFFVVFFMISLLATSQEIKETNTDSLYFKSLRSYKKQDFQTSLKLANKGLQLAPEYHDIRILRIRDYWALNMLLNASKDLEFLLEKAPDYPGVREMVLKQTRFLKDPVEALKYIDKIEKKDSLNHDLKLLKAQLLLENKQPSEAREIALELFNNPELDKNDRYVLQNILKRTISNEIGINYQYISFSDDYNREDWQTISPEFQHYFNKTAVIARLNYTNRVSKDGILYELEAYPVFSDKVYAFVNVGISDGNLYPNLRTQASIFFNIFKILELETGGRLLHFSENDYFSGVLGMTMYQGKFYLNTRVFLGPEFGDRLIQNYQFNLRYYLNNVDNYFFLRLGTGISPDQRAIFTQVQKYPDLNAYYSNLGINFSIGPRHIIQLGAGYLFEEINTKDEGDQVVGSLGYRFRF